MKVITKLLSGTKCVKIQAKRGTKEAMCEPMWCIWVPSDTAAIYFES